MASGKEVVFDLDAAAFASDDFRMYQFKVKRCPRARPHDWTQCPFAHPGEKAKRRDPRRYRYSGTACPEFRRNGCCRRGDACPFAHGVFECWLHPSRYRTQSCTDGLSCRRRVCFFAHTDAEMRKPDEDPVWLQQQLQAELAAEQQAQQQAQAFKIFATLLGNQTSASATNATAAPDSSAELLKNVPLTSLTALLGSSTPASATTTGAASTQQTSLASSGSGSLEEQLRSILQNAQLSSTNAPSPSSQNSPTLLQLISVVEKMQGTSGASSSTDTGEPSAGAASSLQLQLAQQLLTQPEQLQAHLGQLEPSKQAQALEMLRVITGSGNNAGNLGSESEESPTDVPPADNSDEESDTSPAGDTNVAAVNATGPPPSAAPAQPAAVPTISDSNAAIAAMLDNQAKVLSNGGSLNIAALEGLLSQLKAAEAQKQAATAPDPQPPRDSSPEAGTPAAAPGGTASAANTAAAIALLNGSMQPQAMAADDGAKQPPAQGGSALAAALSALSTGAGQPAPVQPQPTLLDTGIMSAELLASLANEDVIRNARALLDSISMLKAGAPSPTSTQPPAAADAGFA